jgi:hypothetical protein
MFMVTTYLMGSTIGKSTIGKFAFDLSGNIIFVTRLLLKVNKINYNAQP